ncbi:MAG: nicotinate-nucleotide--dimethylbenzimidazole phosphoribosyltransferase [Alteromonadaceae bacterium]|nr:MAG: nicotinate-nucleotide--dimethylbenzimidazole phosphoribosyltransferase [Alteromonadaceae bacterium]
MNDSNSADKPKPNNNLYLNNNWYLNSTKALDTQALTAAKAHQTTLTKPPGSLGILEEIALKFAAWQGCVKPQVKDILVRIFAADHGVCAQGVSAFPQAVTGQMVANFLSGGAAISVLSRDIGANFAVVNAGTASELDPTLASHNSFINRPIAAGTQDFSLQAAMSPEQCLQALQLGCDIVKQIVKQQDCQIFIGGDMGIGNTSSASAIYSALLNLSAETSVGPGTGVEGEALKNKQEVVTKALNLHQQAIQNLSHDNTHINKSNSTVRALKVLQCLGGFEIAALSGAYIACAQKGIPILVDGFICTAAALVAQQINPGVKDWMLFAHRSAEPAHQLALEYFDAKPLLDLGLRLGEGSGAALAWPIISAALNLHNNMATFTQAGVAEKSATNDV